MEVGAAGGIRTRGLRVEGPASLAARRRQRSETRVGSWSRARTCRPCGCLINNQVRLPIPPSRKDWWSERDSNPHLPLARRWLFRLSYRPEFGAWCWFRANLSAVSARRCHQISFPGELVRTAGLEPAPPEWRSGTLPLSHVRRTSIKFGAPPRIRTSRRPTCRFHRRRFYRPVAGEGRAELVGENSGGGLRVRTPVLYGPLGFRDRLPAAPAEPSVSGISNQ